MPKGLRERMNLHVSLGKLMSAAIFLGFITLAADAGQISSMPAILEIQFKAIKRQGDSIIAVTAKNLDAALDAYRDVASLSRDALRLYEGMPPEERNWYRSTAKMASDSLLSALLNTSSIYCQQKSFDKAEDVLNEAGLIAEVNDDPLLKRQCVLKLADFKWLSRNYVAAGLLYERLLREQEPVVVADPRWEVRSGAAGATESNLQDQMQTLNEALTSWSVYMSLASLYTYINDPGNALRVYELPGFVRLRKWLEHVADDMPMADETSPNAILAWAAKLFPAFYHIGKGGLMQQFERHADALAEFASASALIGKTGFTEVRYSLQTLRGVTLQKTGHMDEAVWLYRDSIGLTASMTPGIRDLAECYAHIYLADALIEQRKIDEACGEIARAEKLARLIDEPRQLWDVLYLKGRAYQVLGRLEDAATAYAESIEQVEKFRARLSLERLKRDYMATRVRVYESLVQVLLELNRPFEALSYVERAKARAFVDLFGSIDKKCLLKSGEHGDLQPEFERLKKRRQQLDESQDEIDRQLRGVPGALPDRRGLAFIQSVGKEADQLQKDEDRLYGLAGSEFADFSAVNPVPLDEVEGLIDEETVLVEYYRSPSRDTAWIFTLDSAGLRRKTPVAVALPGSDKQLNAKIIDFRNLINTDTGYCTARLHAKSRELYDILIAPVEAVLDGKKRLVLVLHGSLNFLPFAALEGPDGHYLMERFRLVHLPSANCFRFCRRKNSRRHESLLAFAFGLNCTATLGPLPGTISEVDSIGSLFPPDKRVLVASGSMTITEFASKASDKDIIHLATHGVLDPAMPMESAIMLGSVTMPVREVTTLELHAALVTLSACQTAIGKVYAGDEVVGLTRAFMYAGTPTVLSSLWPVSDASCEMLMASFYRHFMNGEAKDEALRAAQIELLAKYPSPFHWAPFILTGDWE